MLRSLKNRLLAWFLLIAFAVAFTVFPLNYLHKKEDLAIRNSVYQLNDIQIRFIKDIKYTSEFLSFEITNPKFFITGESPYLSAHNDIQDTLQIILSNISPEYNFLSPLQKSSIEDIRSAYSNFCTTLDSIVYYIYKRGYRDLGLEGEMISYIYEAEKDHRIRARTLEIRRNEREYLNRNDSVYILSLNTLVNKLITNISLSNSYSLQEKTRLIGLFKLYQDRFNKLVAIDNVLGLKTNTGLKAKLNKAGMELEAEVKSAIKDARRQELTQLARLNMLFGILSALIIIGATIISLYLSRHMVNSLEQLTKYISELAKNNFRYSEKLNLRRSSREIREIYKEFRNMVAQLRIREKQRDDALTEATINENKYRELADLLPQSIFETDNLGNLSYVNKAWYTTFGYTQQDLDEGLNLIEILNTDNNNKIFGYNKVENSDYIAIKKDGTRFPAQVYSDTILKNNNFVGRRGIIINATLRNKYIETLQKETLKAVTSDKHKSSFLANMSHEIRTPMNSIIGFANLLSSDEIAENQKQDFVDYIKSSGKLLLNLIDDIIDTAKIEAGEIKIKHAACYPVKLIQDICNSFEGYKSSIGKDNIELKTVIKDNIGAFKTDPFRLKQILSNLISNAIKFTEQGSVAISLGIKNERFLEFSVEDTGVGLTKEELNIIFSRFKRTDRSEVKNIKGTGLGLSISKNLVELLGGQMWVSSEPGVGTKFWFHLPYSPIPDSKGENSVSKISDQSNGYCWSDKTILVAEDDDYSFTYLKELLKITNARVVRAVNGREVVEAVKFTDNIDIVLMDIQMPFLDGYQATEEIKKLNPNLPVIAQTAFAMEGDKEKSVMAGCDDYITKPLSPSKLLAKIDQFFKKTLHSSNQPEAKKSVDEIVKKQTSSNKEN
ncbi:MAG: response regulator [Bacteroidales bacterium]|nr:response regulator [Bacteroidales bacterium]